MILIKEKTNNVIIQKWSLIKKIKSLHYGKVKRIQLCKIKEQICEESKKKYELLLINTMKI